MGSKDRLSKKASDAAHAAQGNEYIQRLIEDEDLRSSLMAAYESARSAYGRLTDGTPSTKALLEDDKLQSELKQAVDALRNATSSLRGGEAPTAGRRGRGRGLLVLAFGAVLAVAVNQGLRTKLLDMLFGAEEEFDYSSTTTPATPEPAVATGS